MKNQEEVERKFKELEREIGYIDSQLKAVEEGIKEISLLKDGLNELVGKKGEEIFAPIGRGIFVHAKLESEDLLVNIGENKFIKKSIPETKKTIEDQIEKLNEIQERLIEELQRIDKELTQTIKEDN
jgi:prefoldin alpha subunit